MSAEKRPRKSRRAGRWILGLSLLLNLFVALPALVVLCGSSGIRFYLYEQVAARFGGNEIVFLGDSITRDGGIWGVRIGRPWFSVRNLAHAALYTEQMPYQAHIAVAGEAELAFLMAGINDRPKDAEGVDASFAAYREVVEILREGGVRPVIQSTLFTENDSDREFVAGLNARLRELAENQEGVYLDLNDVLSRDGSLRPEYSRDGTHLTEEAYRVWAARLREFLETEQVP